MNKKVIVKQETGNEIATEVIAQHIIAISEGVRKLLNGPLNEKAIVLLIQHAAPQVNWKDISQKQIKAVLNGMQSLESQYLKSKKPTQ